MNYVIFKYDLDKPINVLELPALSEPLHVAMQHHVLRLWVQVPQSTDNPKVFPPVARTFVVVGTGQEFTDHGKYIGTAMTEHGTSVWHVFEKP